MPNKSGTPPLNLPNEVEFKRLMSYVAAKLKKALFHDDAKGVRNCHIIYTMFFSGASAEDLECMRVGDIDLHQGWINIGAEGSLRRRKVNINVSFTTLSESLSIHLRYWLNWKRDHGESIEDDAPLFSVRPGFVQRDLGDPLSAAGYYTVWKNIRNSANLRRYHFSFKCARVWFVRAALKFYKNAQYISGLTAIPLKDVMELTKDMRLEQPTKEAPARKLAKKKGTALPKKAHPEKAKAPPKVNIEDTIDTAFTQSIARAFHETVSDVRAIKRQMTSQERQLVRIESHIDSIDKAMTQLPQKQMATTAKTSQRKPSAEPDGDAVSLDVSDLLAMLKEMEKQAVLMRMQSQMLSDDHEKQRCIDESSGMLKVLAALRYRYHAQFESVAKTEEP